MAQTRYIHFGVTQEQSEAIKRNARDEGFKTISNYLRDLGLHRSSRLQDKLDHLLEIEIQNNDLLNRINERRKRGK
jgi:hypothetical protein